MIRTKGEAGTGNVVEAVRHMRTITSQMKALTVLGPEEIAHAAKELGAPLELVRGVAATGKLPVVNFSAGGISTPADATLLMQLGVDGNFGGSGIFKSEDPATIDRKSTRLNSSHTVISYAVFCLKKKKKEKKI